MSIFDTTVYQWSRKFHISIFIIKERNQIGLNQRNKVKLVFCHMRKILVIDYTGKNCYMYYRYCINIYYVINHVLIEIIIIYMRHILKTYWSCSFQEKKKISYKKYYFSRFFAHLSFLSNHPDCDVYPSLQIRPSTSSFVWIGFFKFKFEINFKSNKEEILKYLVKQIFFMTREIKTSSLM